MVSTFLSYDMISRDMQKSLDRVASEAQVKRDTQYFQENIGKVKSVDDFMGDYKLYSYAMKSYGLEDMTYAKAFMRKVLSSDLTDPSSFANSLADQKYRDFASAFKFSSSTAIVQTTSQQNSTVSAYQAQIAQEETDANTETSYFKQAVGKIGSVKDLINNGRVYDYALKSVGLDPNTYSRDFITKVLTSDTNDANSYLNTLPTKSSAQYALKDKAQELRKMFNFNTSGTLDSGTTAQTAAQTTTTVDNYLTTVPSHVTAAAALINKDYIATQMASVTKVDDITGNQSLFSFVKTALGLDSSMLASTFKNIVTSDTSTQNSYAYQQGGNTWVAVAKMFNFDTSGNVASGGSAMTADNLTKLQNRYMSNYAADDNANDTAIYTYYKGHIGGVKTVDDLLSNSALYSFALKSVGLNAIDESQSKIKRVLESDLNDPKSYANQLSDPRYLALAKEYNFGADGKIAEPKLAQSQAEMTLLEKNYIKAKTKFDNTTAKTAATDDTTYYTNAIQGVSTVSQLVSDQRLVKVILGSYGIDSKGVTNDFLKKVLTSDLSDPNSFANKQTDERWAQLAGSFNFNSSGNVQQMDTSKIMGRRAEMATVDNYYHQSLEQEAGDDNTGVRLALYFQRMAPTLTSAYDILGDTALLQFFKTAYQMPDGFSNLPVDTQAAKVKQFINLPDLSDPTKVKSMVDRFTAMYDLENSTAGTASTASIFTAGSSASISGDTLLSIAQLKLA